jgi:iron complex outermembrane receptor protein
VELDANGKLGQHWRFTGNLAYTDAYVAKDNTLAVGSRLINVPRVSGSVLAIFENADAHGAPYGLGGGLNYVGARTGDQAGQFRPTRLRDGAGPGLLAVHPGHEAFAGRRQSLQQALPQQSYSNVWIMPGDERNAVLALNVKF